MTTSSGEIQEELTNILSAAAGIPMSLVQEFPDGSLEELGLDSLGTMQLQAVVKDRFGVLIPDDSLEMSFGEITRYVIARLGDE
jgi:acyl carrier protein